MFVRTIALAILILENGAARAVCDDFGKHSAPPAPINSPPIEDLPFGKFTWGTEAFRDNSGFWWVNHIVRNGADAPPLAVDWVKAGIDRSINYPLQQGEPICKSRYVGNSRQPIPDTNAPILYHLDRHTDAAVYSGPDQSSAPPADASGRIETHIETTIKNSKGVSEPIRFGLGMRRDGKNMRLSLISSGHFQVGLPGFSSIFGLSATEQIQSDLAKQGLKTVRAPLLKFADGKALKAVFWHRPEPTNIETSDTLFFSNGSDETRAVASTFGVNESEKFETRPGLALIFDDQNSLVLLTTIDYSVPVRK